MHRISHKYRYGLLAAFISFFPLIASAHALPVASTPESAQVLQSAPSEVSIQFSENVDPSASSIIVTGPSGSTVSTADAFTDPHNAHIFSVPMKNGGNGTYIVAWSSVSADDGHFTKGAYPFIVGTMSSMASSSMMGASDVEIVELSTTPEAFSSAIELMGHGFLWAALLLFALAIRPLLRGGTFEDVRRLINRVYAYFLYLGAILALIGGAAQLAVKTTQLASLRSVDTLTAFHIYIGTEAGIATLVRMGAVALLLVVFLWGRKVITTAERITFYEIVMFLLLCCFAYYRAKISHATSNPFHPGFSILVNFFHVIEKDIWAGIAGILLTLALVPRARRFLDALMPRAFAMLAVDFGLVSITASYIVWLHLKTFDNLFSTSWGGAFLDLLVIAVLMVGMRIYHVFARIYSPRFFASQLALSLAAEFAFAMLVVYYSSVVIITSPPLPQPPTPVFSTTDQHITIKLERDPYIDNTLLLSISGGTGALSTPVVSITNENDGTDVSVGLTKQFDGAYTFPQALVDDAGPYDVAVTVPQTGGYDAHAAFTLPQGTFDVDPNFAASRSFDLFTVAVMLIAALAGGFSLVLYHFSRREGPFATPRRSSFAELFTAAIFLVCVFGGAGLVQALNASPLINPYAYECENDGNMWHTMLPTMAGIPTSQTPAEGCMWGMGNYMYMFPDKREYDYYSSFPHAVVTLDHAPFVAGTPTTFTINLKEPDGSPAKLFTDMDKLIHVIIVSKDETVFAHIHPDDTHPLSQQEIDTSTFSLNYTFPKSGTYLISVDYAHGLTLESKQFTVNVTGYPDQSQTIQEYPQSGAFEGYQVSLDAGQPFAGDVTTIRYTITKDGRSVTDIVPYLEAAMHVSVVKNDFTSFLHVHGEVHPPGTPLPPIIVKNGQVIHSMAMMTVPPTFGPTIEAHFIFPASGLYTIWGEFKVGTTVIPTSFTVRVE